MDSESGDATPKPRGKNRDLIQRIRDSADQMEQEGSTRGDLKLLSRAIRELRYGFKVFGPYRRHPKVTVFGSARTPPEAPAYKHAVAFGQQAAEEGWMVITGAANGIMEAGHVGAGREMSMGLNILLPFETDANHVIEGDHKLVHMRYFFTRKVLFVKECMAVACFSGGFGTLDEALEVLTLLQTGKRELVPVMLIDEPGGTYWKNFDVFVRAELLEKGMISEEDLNLYLVTESVEEAIAEMVGFYRVFHSMRYVKDRLVLRLFKTPGEEVLDEINQDFGGILKSGKIEVSEALPEERGEADLADLPRLVMHFNRRNLGQLRRLINRVNLD